jgi:hypothetical protein
VRAAHELACEPRLPDTRLAADERHASISAQHAIQQAHQFGPLWVSPDERRPLERPSWRGRHGFRWRGITPQSLTKRFELDAQLTDCLNSLGGRLCQQATNEAIETRDGLQRSRA